MGRGCTETTILPNFGVSYTDLRVMTKDNNREEAELVVSVVTLKYRSK